MKRIIYYLLFVLFSNVSVSSENINKADLSIDDKNKEINKPYLVALTKTFPPELLGLSLELDILFNIPLLAPELIGETRTTSYSKGPFISGNRRYVTVTDGDSKVFPEKEHGIFIVDLETKLVTYQEDHSFQWLINSEHYYHLMWTNRKQPLDSVASIPITSRKGFNLYLYKDKEHHKIGTYPITSIPNSNFIDGEGLALIDGTHSPFSISFYDYDGKLSFYKEFENYYINRYLSKEDGLILQKKDTKKKYHYDLVTEKITRMSELDSYSNIIDFDKETKDVYLLRRSLTWKLKEVKIICKYNLTTKKKTQLSSEYGMIPMNIIF